VDKVALENISVPVLGFYEDKQAMPGNLKKTVLFVKLERNG